GVIRGLIVFLFLSCTAFAQQSLIIVPGSPAPLKRNFVFTNSASGSVILFYEVRLSTSSTLKVEVRRPKDMSLIRQFTIASSPSLLLRQADYRQQNFTILAVLQSLRDGSLHTITINDKSGSTLRSNLSAASSTPPVGLTWNSTLNCWAIIAGSTLVS